MKQANRNIIFLAAIAASCLSTQANGMDFTVNGNGHLNIKTSCSVRVEPTTDKTISVNIDGSPKDEQKFDIAQQGDTVTVKEVGDACSNATIVGNGNVIINGDNIVSINNVRGRVFVNGREIKTQDQESGASRDKLPVVVIKAPEGSDFDAELSGGMSLTSSVSFGEANLSLSGSTTVKKFEARKLGIDATGSSEVIATVRGGPLTVGLSGSGEIKARGEFESVKAQISGSGYIGTYGPVRQGYKAGVAGSGEITHHGRIGGIISPHTSGSGTITFGD